MALLGNYTVFNKTAGRFTSGTSISNTLGNFRKSGANRNWFIGWHNIPNETNKGAVPNGYDPPYSWVIAYKDGGMALYVDNGGVGGFSNVNLAGGLLANSSVSGSGDISNANIAAFGNILASLVQSGSITAAIAGQLNAVATVSGTNTLSSDLGAIVSILSTIENSGTITSSIQAALAASSNISGSNTLISDISGQLNAAATFVSVGSLTSDIIGQWDMGVSLSGSSTLVGGIRAIADIISNIVGENTLTGSFGGGSTKGYMNASITSFSTLSPESLAAAVWNSIAADFNLAGSMGNKVNSAASAGDPWGTSLPSSYTGTQAGAIIAQIQTLVDELHTLQGLNNSKPSTVTPTTWEAGDIVIDITGDGETSSTMTRQP